MQCKRSKSNVFSIIFSSNFLSWPIFVFIPFHILNILRHFSRFYVNLMKKYKQSRMMSAWCFMMRVNLINVKCKYLTILTSKRGNGKTTRWFFLCFTLLHENLNETPLVMQSTLLNEKKIIRRLLFVTTIKKFFHFRFKLTTTTSCVVNVKPVSLAHTSISLVYVGPEIVVLAPESPEIV